MGFESPLMEAATTGIWINLIDSILQWRRAGLGLDLLRSPRVFSAGFDWRFFRPATFLCAAEKPFFTPHCNSSPNISCNLMGLTPVAIVEESVAQSLLMKS